MGETTKIEWADATVNFWWGCTKVSEACRNCYAETWAKRTRGMAWGVGAPREKIAGAIPLARKLQKQAERDGRRIRVFTNSMSDFFDAEVDPAWRAEAWETIRATPNLTWMILTKRPENISKMLPADWGAGWAHVWIGCTVESQPDAEARLPKLLAVPAAVHFVSMEPLLGAVDIGRYLPPHHNPERSEQFADGTSGPCLSWVIVGGESGHGARPMHPDWARSIRDQCERAGVAFHFKQWGDWAPVAGAVGEDAIDALYDPVPEGQPSDSTRRCRVEYGVVHGVGEFAGQVLPIGHPRAFWQGTDSMTVFRMGKKIAGRLLDGRTWDGLPCSAPPQAQPGKEPA